jgi:hypothetical protein
MKKFSDKYLNQFQILANAKIGFEFEFYADKSYYKLLEYLNRELAPIKVSGFRRYHSKFKPTKNHFKIEPDLSLGYEGVEIITGPLDYVNSKTILLKILKIIEDYGRTDEKCSLHINVSFDPEKTDQTLDYLNKLKLILNVDEDKIYSFFPHRKNNFYAKSVKKLIPFKDYNFSDAGANLLINNLELPDTRYYGINIKNVEEGRLEYRYIGGENYQQETHKILQLLDYFTILTWECITEEFNEEDRQTLEDYLNENINNFKNFSSLDNFLAEFPSIKLQMDKRDSYEILKTYYDRLYHKLYDLISNIYNLADCIINYDTDTGKLEIFEAKFKTIFDLKGINLIDCIVEGGSYHKCNFQGCELKNVHLTNSTLQNTEVFKSKLENSRIDPLSEVKECYLFNSYLDGKMSAGVFRSGRIGEFGELADDVKIITKVNNYFGTERELGFEDKKKLLNTGGKDKKNYWTNKK